MCHGSVRRATSVMSATSQLDASCPFQALPVSFGVSFEDQRGPEADPEASFWVSGSHGWTQACSAVLPRVAGLLTPNNNKLGTVRPSSIFSPTLP